MGTCGELVGTCGGLVGDLWGTCGYLCRTCGDIKQIEKFENIENVEQIENFENIETIRKIENFEKARAFRKTNISKNKVNIRWTKSEKTRTCQRVLTPFDISLFFKIIYTPMYYTFFE